MLSNFKPLLGMGIICYVAKRLWLETSFSKRWLSLRLGLYGLKNGEVTNRRTLATYPLRIKFRLFPTLPPLHRLTASTSETTCPRTWLFIPKAHCPILWGCGNVVIELDMPGLSH